VVVSGTLLKHIRIFILLYDLVVIYQTFIKSCDDAGQNSKAQIYNKIPNEQVE
jgi:hypothetical protein